MLYPALGKTDVLSILKRLIDKEQFERLSSMKFKGMVSFKLNSAHMYEGRIFHEMCRYGVTPDMLSELRWVNHKYKNGEFPVRGLVKNIL